MLRITITDGPAEQRWTLQGRLVAPWVAVLETSWKRSHDRCDSRKCIVDLRDVTLIDGQGEEALREMSRAGAEFIACGVETRHVVELIKSQCKCR